MRFLRPRLATLPGWIGLLLVISPAFAAEPYIPTGDEVVLERAVPVRDPAFKLLREQRRGWSAAPQDPAASASYARAAIALGREQADPRYFGQADAALAAWEQDAAAPAEIAWLQAVLQQQRHDFGGALASLERLLAREPAYAPALLTRAVVLTVQGQPRAAQRDCAALVGKASLAIISTCAAAASSLAGRAGTALAALDTLSARPADGAEQQSWTLTLAAEIATRLERPDAQHRHAQALEAQQRNGVPDPYLRVAYADFLLDHGGAAEVVGLLSSHTREDNALLRLALAQVQLDDPSSRAAAAAHVEELAARFAAVRERGEAAHAREEALFALRLRADAPAALRLAAENWRSQREPLDARILLEAALAANDAAAAQPVLQWMRDTGIEDPLLHRLAVSLGGLQP